MSSQPLAPKTLADSARLEIFDEYTRRQFVAKAPQRNPYGTEETPNKFAEFDVFTKIRVLHQLSTWTLNNAERMRSLMEEKDNEQTQWVGPALNNCDIID